MTQEAFDFDRDITSNYHGGDAESIAAHEAIKEFKGASHRRILSFGFAQGALGMTCDEAEIALNLKHQNCSARFSELKKSRQILWTGETRKTRGKCAAKVFVVPAALLAPNGRNLMTG